jgi:hypothetical protein
MTVRTPRDAAAWSDIPSVAAEALVGRQGPGGGPLPVSASLQYYLPEIFPIPGSSEFDRFTHVNSPGAGTLTPAALQLRLPQGNIGILRVINAGVDNMTAVTRISFRIRINQGNVQGPAGNFQLFAGPAARVTGSADVFVRIPAGSLVDLAIVNTDGAAYDVGAGYSGWFWTEALDRAWRGLV